MQRCDFRKVCWAAAFVAAGVIAGPSNSATASGPPVANVNGAGALYIPSIDAESLFGMGVLIDADGASGHFECHIPGPTGSALAGDVSDGSLNDDGSVTFSGVCFFVLPGLGIVPDLPYEVTAYPGGPGEA